MQAICTVQFYYIGYMFLQAGLTSLILAVQNQHVEVVEALLNARCNPNTTENVSIE